MTNRCGLYANSRVLASEEVASAVGSWEFGENSNPGTRPPSPLHGAAFKWLLQAVNRQSLAFAILIDELGTDNQQLTKLYVA